MSNEIVAVKTLNGVEVNALDPEAALAQANAAKDDSADTTATGKKKSSRGPGRPKTRVSTPQTVLEGIVKKPTYPNHMVEIVYENPMIFRKIFSLLNVLGGDTYTVDFNEKTIEFAGKGHHTTKELVRLTIYGDALTKYYVKEPLSKSITLSDVEKRTKTVNRGHDTISLLIREEDFRSNMYMILHVHQYDVDLPLPIEFTKPSETKAETPASDENYPIRFEMDSKQFKSMINSFTSGLSADRMVIKKVGDQPMFIIPYNGVKQISDGMPFKNPEKINLRSTVGPDDIFSATVIIYHFKSLASANIGSKIEIAADNFKPMVFTTMIDKRSVSKKVGEEILTNDEYVFQLKLFVEIEK